MTYFSDVLQFLADLMGYVRANKEDLQKYAQLAVPLIALVAGLIAVSAISAQHKIARRRAALDFFMKTDLDFAVDKLYRSFRDTTDKIERGECITQEEYKDLKHYLNILDLCACGIRYGALSEKVTKEYWGDWLPYAFGRAKTVINYMRVTSSEGVSATYAELEKQARKWGYTSDITAIAPPPVLDPSVPTRSHSPWPRVVRTKVVRRRFAMRRPVAPR